ncbi:MAG: hypothetical protein AAF602_12310 [Myxococcota bacterium]
MTDTTEATAAAGEPVDLPDIPDIWIGKTCHSAVLPRAPLRFLLNRAIQDALGFTRFDLEQMKQGQTVAPSGVADAYALQCAYYAVVGVCWATSTLPVKTLRECRHDVIEYGEGVLEHFLLTLEEDLATVGKQLVDEGRKLHRLMMTDVTTKLATDIKAERDFSKVKEEASTSG